MCFSLYLSITNNHGVSPSSQKGEVIRVMGRQGSALLGSFIPKVFVCHCLGLCWARTNAEDYKEIEYTKGRGELLGNSQHEL